MRNRGIPGTPPGVEFPFRFDPNYQRAARLFGIRPSDTGIEVSDTQLTARYGRWHIDVALTNIARVSITGPYWFVRTAGPPRLGFDRSVTFASNGERGVQIDFREPIRAIGPVRHTSLTVTPVDCEALRAAVEARVR